MPRPTQTSIYNPSDRAGTTYGPRQNGSTQNAQVHASLDVRTGPSSAERFAAALGLVNQTAQPA